MTHRRWNRSLRGDGGDGAGHSEEVEVHSRDGGGDGGHSEEVEVVLEDNQTSADVITFGVHDTSGGYICPLFNSCTPHQ